MTTLVMITSVMTALTTPVMAPLVISADDISDDGRVFAVAEVHIRETFAVSLIQSSLI